MKIVKDVLQPKEYHEIDIGEAFMYSGKLYMVTDELEGPPDQTYKSVCLESGEITCFGSRVTVFAANCEVHMKAW